jgi:GDPmannose 4,6-dehydratase
VNDQEGRPCGHGLGLAGEVDHLHGDSSRARAKLGWQPRVTFTELIQMMVRADEADVRGAIAGRAPRM